MEKKYKIFAPVGNVVTFKEVMTEKELRDFAIQIVQDQELGEVWKEKIEKDEIAEIVEWLRQSGYTIQEM